MIQPHPRLFTSVCWFFWGWSLVYGLTEVVSFNFKSDTGIVSWVSRNEYPKIQEIFWFLTVTCGIPMLVYLGNSFDRAFLRRDAQTLRRICCFLLLFPLFGIALLKSHLSLWVCVITLVCYALGLALVRLLPIKDEVTDLDEKRDEVSEPIDENKANFKASHLRKLKVCSVLVLGILFIYLERFYPVINRRVDLFHEGEFLLPLYEFWNGAVPYRDIYLQHGLFHNLGIPFLGASLFGFELSSVRAIHAVVHPLGWVGAYVLLCCLTRFSVIPALAFVFFASETHIHVQERAFFGCLALACLSLGVHHQGQSKKIFFMNGVFCALAFLHSVEVGFYATAASGVILILIEILSKLGKWKIRGYPLLISIWGFLTMMSPFWVYLWYHGGMTAFIENLFIQVKYQSEVWGLPFPSPLAMLEAFASGDQSFEAWLLSKKVSLIYGPFLLTLLGGVMAHRLGRSEKIVQPNSLVMFLLFLTGLTFFRTNLGRSDGGHFSYNYMISLLIICFGVYGVLSSAKTWLSNRSWVQGVFGLILLGLAVWLPLEWIEKNTPNHYKKRKAENKERRLFPVKEDQDVIPSYQFRQIKALKAFINENTSQDDFIYDYSNQCAHLFFSERKSSSRFFMPVYAVLEDHQREVIENIEKKKVPYIFYQSSRSFRNVDGFPTRDRTPFLHNYILGNYSPYRWVGGIEVWKRKENP